MSTDDLHTLLGQGYVICRAVAAETDVHVLSNDLAPHFDACPGSNGPFSGYQTGRFSGLFGKSAAAVDFALNERILTLCRQVLEPNCDRLQIHLTQAIDLRPGQRMQAPHFDDVVYPSEHQGIEYQINVMWPITPFRAENGATLLWPGTHRMRRSNLGPDNLPAPIAAEADPGDAIVWLGSVVHAGGANHTGASRRSMVISYSLGWLRQAENHYLTYRADQVLQFPAALQELLGYVAHRPNLGWVNGDEPIKAIREGLAPRPATDLLDPVSQQRLDAFVAAQAA